MLQNTAVKQQVRGVSSFKKWVFLCMTGSLTRGGFQFNTGTSFGFLPKAGAKPALANRFSLLCLSPAEGRQVWAEQTALGDLERGWRQRWAWLLETVIVRKLVLELKLTLSSSGRGRGNPLLPWGGLSHSVLPHRLLSRQPVSCLPRHRAWHLSAHTPPAQPCLPLPSEIKLTSAGHTPVNPPHPVHSPAAVVKSNISFPLWNLQRNLPKSAPDQASPPAISAQFTGPHELCCNHSTWTQFLVSLNDNQVSEPCLTLKQRLPCPGGLNISFPPG